MSDEERPPHSAAETELTHATQQDGEEEDLTEESSSLLGRDVVVKQHNYIIIIQHISLKLIHLPPLFSLYSSLFLLHIFFLIILQQPLYSPGRGDSLIRFFKVIEGFV